MTDFPAASEAVANRLGLSLKKPAICHGYVNGCICEKCEPRHEERVRRIEALGLVASTPEALEALAEAA